MHWQDIVDQFKQQHITAQQAFALLEQHGLLAAALLDLLVFRDQEREALAALDR